MKRIMISSNIFYLSSSRVINLSFPLYILYFITHNFGIEPYGKYVYFVAVFTFLTLFVSLNSDSYSAKILKDKNTAFRFCITFIPRILLFSTLTLIYLFICILISEDINDFIFKFFFIFVTLQLAIIPYYYFQATGSFILLFYCVLFDKLIALFVLNIFQPDINFIPLIIFSSSLISIFMLYYHLKRQELIRIDYSTRILKRMMRHYILVNSQLLLGKITQVNTSLAKVILEIFAGVYYVAIFDIFEKLINFAKIPFSLIYQYTFSRIDINFIKMRNYFLSNFIFALSLILIINIFGDDVFKYFNFEEFEDTSTAFFIFSLTIMIIPFTQTFTYFIVLRSYSIKIFSNLQLLSNLISIILLILIILYNYSFIKFILWVLICEMILPLLSIVFLLKKVYENK